MPQLSIHNMVAGMIDKYGSDAQRERHLPGLLSFDTLGSYCLTEPGAGSDAGALTTSARRDGDDLVINGSKAFISGGGEEPGVLVVMARTDASSSGGRGISALLVPKDAPGVSFGANERKLGWHSQPTRATTFEDVRVRAADALLGDEGAGFRYAMEALDGGRLSIASASVGAASTALERALEHTSMRQAFGGVLSDLQVSESR